MVPNAYAQEIVDAGGAGGAAFGGMMGV